MGLLAHYTSHSTRYTTLFRALRYLAGGVLLILVLCVSALYLVLRASLPQIEGELRASGTKRSATIERDALGVPTIRAQSRNDLAFATGVAHAQDRFFQMDLMRRAAAGEMAALLGPSLIDADRTLRRHLFRQVAAQVVRNASPREREVLAAYVGGVNFGVEEAGTRSWEYQVLRTQPAPWSLEDSVLVAFSMYLSLNDSTGTNEIARARLRASLPAELYAFLHPVGTEWDAPIVGGAWRTPPVPGPDVFDLREKSDVTSRVGRSHVSCVRTNRDQPEISRDSSKCSSSRPASTSGYDQRKSRVNSLQHTEYGLFGKNRPADMPGSNSWAVAGTHAANGAALLANDMHLGLRLPNTWYQARLIVEAAGPDRRDLVGVTLPGLPFLIVGSNGQVAWGFTNSYGDWTDVVELEIDPRDAARYLTPDGSEPFRLHRERIQVNGASDVPVEFQSTRWGPVIQTDAESAPLALAWTAHHAQATNFRLLDFETAGSIETVLALANQAGIPVQNFVAADASGRIGWSLIGQIPVRGDYDATVPSSWRSSDSGWVGWRRAEEYPRLIDPPTGRLWSANARTLDAQTWFELVGDGGYDIGARAAQIRDALFSEPAATAQGMAELQIDDRALFLTRWRDLLLGILDGPAVIEAGHRREARRLVKAWSGRAAASDPGYHIVRAFRNQVREAVFASLTVAARTRFADTAFSPSAQFEGPLWLLVTEEPPHLLDPRYDSWTEALLASLDTALDELLGACDELSSCTWGRENTLNMRHPLSAALPFVSRWLDMPRTPMSGDAAMPRVQSPSFGASQRMVVSPGREAEGLFQMPGGQASHPLSPFYGAGHEQWVKGAPRSLLPGEAEYVLRLRP